MHNHLRYHAQKEEFEKSKGKAKADPVVAVFQHVETVTLEVNLSVKVHFMKSLHRDSVLARIFQPVILVVEEQIVLNRSARISSLLILAW